MNRESSRLSEEVLNAKLAAGEIWPEMQRIIDAATLWHERVQRPGGDRQSIVATGATMLSVSEAQIPGREIIGPRDAAPHSPELSRPGRSMAKTNRRCAVSLPSFDPDQRNLVEWWREHVSVRESNRKANRGPGSLSLEDAEDFSGIAQQKVLRWRKALRGDIDEYHKQLRRPSWRKAMGERGSTDQKGASGTRRRGWSNT